MSKTHKSKSPRFAAACAMAAAVLLAGCAADGAGDGDTAAGDDEASQQEVAPAQMANPAAVFCIEQGGEHDIRKDADGNAVGYCILPDGSEPIAWDYYREMHASKEDAAAPSASGTDGAETDSAETDRESAAAPAVAIANPAAVFCIEQGGTHDIRKDEDGAAYGMCILPDGTEVDAWEYYREMHS